MKRGLFIVLVCFLIGPVQADLLFSSPRIADRDLKKIELGSSPKITVKYRNDTGKEVWLSTIDLYLEHDPSLIDNVIGLTNLNGDRLAEKENTVTPGLIVYKLESIYSNWNLLTVRPGETVPLVEIVVHLNQQVSLPSGNERLLDFSALYPSIVTDNNLNVTGAAARPNPVALEKSAPPEFAGLNFAESANILGIKNPGNTVVLNWITAATNAFDLSKFGNGKLSYRLWRATDPNFSDALELTGNAAQPFTGNLSGKDYVFQDGNGAGLPNLENPLSDGTIYYYKITALDDTSPTPNETVPLVKSVIPMDLTPPADVTDLAAETDDRKITLTWKNPADPDLGGIVIMKNTGQPIAKEALLPASFPDKDGRQYSEGEEPFGPGRGTIAYVSPQEDFDPKQILSGVEDSVSNGVMNYYKLFTYDRAIAGPPREMGRNYSAGVEIAKVAGKKPRPISGFKVLQGALPGEVGFSWTNSPDDFVEGVIVRYATDNDEKFNALTGANIGDLAGIFPVTTGPGEKENYQISLPLGAHYYFKAYPYNTTAVPLDPFDDQNMSEHIFGQGEIADLPLPIHFFKQESLAAYGSLSQSLWNTLLQAGYIDESGAIQPLFDGKKENFSLFLDSETLVADVFTILKSSTTLTVRKTDFSAYGIAATTIWDNLIAAGYIDSNGVIQPAFDGDSGNFKAGFSLDNQLTAQVYELLAQSFNDKGEIVFSTKSLAAKENGQAKVQLWFGKRLYQKELVARGEPFIIEPAGEVRAKFSAEGMVALSSNAGDYSIVIDPDKKQAKTMGIMADSQGKVSTMGTGKVSAFSVRSAPSEPLAPGRHTILLSTKKIEPNGVITTFTEAATVEVAGGPVRLTSQPLPYPSPFSIPRHQKVAIQYGLSSDANIEVYLIGGDGTRIKHFVLPAGSEGGSAGINKITWDGRTDQGPLAGNAIYVGTVIAKDENRLLGKFKLTIFN